MRYVQSITIPANTSRYAPTEQVFAVTPGTLVQLTVQIPWGSAGLAGLRVLYHRHQLYPLTPETWFVGNDTVLTLPDSFELESAPYELTLQGYNDDDTFAHEIIVHVDILESVVRRQNASNRVLETLRGLFGGGQ